MRRMIHHDPRLNVPPEVRDGVREVLSTALNVRNRPTKVKKFAIETSEDALAWTVFRHLWGLGEVGSALGVEGLAPTSIHYWGTSWPPAQGPDRLRDSLCSILGTQFGERTLGLSEPDLIVEGPDRLVVVEVKFGSGNDCRPHYKGFPKYLRDTAAMFSRSADQVASDGYYELVRNWVAGAALAEQRQRAFTLINLAPESCRRSSGAFAASLAQSTDRRFQFVSWPELLARLARPLAPWFGEYLHTRGLIRRES